MIEIDCANIVKNTGDKSEVEIYFGGKSRTVCFSGLRKDFPIYRL